MQQQQRNKTYNYNFNLNKLFSNHTFYIESTDIIKSANAMHVLHEYIRYCLFDTYNHHPHLNINKYVRMMLRYERCNQSVLVKLCQVLCKQLLEEMQKSTSHLKKMALLLALKESNYHFLHETIEGRMNETIGSQVRAKN